MAVIACAQTPDDTRTYTFHVVPCTFPAFAWLPINAHRCSNAYPNFMLVTTGERAPIPSNVGHFSHGNFGLERFGPDISATYVLATQNAKGGRFGQIINFGQIFISYQTACIYKQR